MTGRFPLRPRAALREFLNSEASGAILLMIAAAFALMIANSPWDDDYFAFLGAKLGPLSVLHWINDALMALFFLLVGLEIKRECVDGHLATWADRRLPIIAASAGMIFPALVYLMVVRGDTGLLRGWAIPAATDIAFAIGVLALLGKRAPTSLKLLLTTVAIVDDMGAVAIIAFGYTKALSGAWLLAAIAVLAGIYAANRGGIRRVGFYVAGFALLWVAVIMSGVHATVAGVLTALVVPFDMSKAKPDAQNSTLHRIEHLLQRPVAWVIVPLFGFANAGVTFGAVSPFSRLPLAIALGLFIGKQIGIFGSIWVAIKLGIASKPQRASWLQIYGVALLCGIGFTMSLFIGGLAFADGAMGEDVKIGVLMGSLASAVTGWAVLRASATLIERD